MLNNLLIYRMLIVNACVGAFLVWAGIQGYVGEIVWGDTSRITLAIIGLFAIGMWSLGVRTFKVSKMLNRLKEGKNVDISSVKFAAKGEHIDDISGWLVTLGLIGTVIGFIMALSSMDQSAMATAQGVQGAIGTLVEGMQVAIYTTLAGAFFGLWLDINRRILKTATALMLEDAKESMFLGYFPAEALDPEAVQ